jgi:two-component system cell cycle sensor histidine kinase/response regulator CckA
MKDLEKTKDQLIEELTAVRRRISEVEGMLADATEGPLGIDGTDSSKVVPLDRTQTIDLTALFTSDLTSTSSFNIGGGIEVTTFGKVLQTLPVPIMLIDRSHNVMVANQACEKIDPEYKSILGTPFDTLFMNPSSAEKVRSFIRETFLTRKPQTVSAMLKIGKGRIWGRTTLRPIRVMKERYVLAIIEDLTAEKTQIFADRKYQQSLQKAYDELEDRNRLLRKEVAERKRAEEKLRWNETLLSQMATSSPLGHLVVDNRTDDILYSNHRFCQIWRIEHLADHIKHGQLNHNAVILHCVSQISDVEAFVESCKPLQNVEDRSIIEDTIDLVDGRTIRRFSTQIRDEADRYLGRSYIFEDISEKMRREKELRESEERFRTIFETAHDSIFIKTRDLAYSHVNPAMERIFGRPAKELIGLTDEDLFGKERGQHIREVDSRVLSGETIEEEHAKRVDGHTMTFHVIKVPIYDRAGDIVELFGIARDFTERKDMEEALRQSERRFRELAELLPQIVYEVDVSGTFTFVNQGGLDFTGYTEDDVAKGLIALDVVVPSDRARLASIMEEVVNGEKRSDECHFLRKDGSPIPLQVFASPIVRDDQICGIRGVAVDLSDLRNAQKATLLSRASFNSIVERCVDGMIVVDLDGRMLYANPSAASLLGRSQDEVGELWFDKSLVDVDITEVKIVGPGGMHGLAEMRLEKTDWEGEPAYLVMLRDITEQRKAEKVQRRLATAIEQSVETIIITDSEGVIEYVNPIFEATSGYTVAEVIGRKTKFWLSDEYDEDFYNQLLNTVRSGIVWTGRFISKRKDGTLYYEDATISPVRDSLGNIMNYVAVKRDVSEQIGLEQQLRHSQKMEAVGTLAGGIAHDFNNLLQIVVGYGELLSTQIDKTAPCYSDLEIILKAGYRGADLVKSILAFSREAEAAFQPVNLNHEVKHAHKLLLRTIPRMIDIEMHLAGNLKTVRSDPTQIEQILLNLAVNSRDAMPDGGKLIIETENVFLDEDYCLRQLEVTPGNYVRITVSDTGCGMEREVVERIFEPFYTTKKAGEGTGLGLSMVFGIVKSHGGHINCYSEPGVGTTFKIDIPVLDDEIESDVSETKEMPALGTETILVVDDEENIRELARRCLTPTGYQIMTAGNGLHALEVYREKQSDISLVILDLIMPEMGGIECLGELLKIDPNVKVLVTSGFSSDGPTREIIKTRAKGFIDKPFRTKEMLKTIRRVLDEG